MEHRKPSFWGLTPLIVFLAVYLLGSIILNDFYAVPLSVAFVVAAVYAMAITRDIKLEERISLFTDGARDANIITMVWIFVLAGAFASGAKAIGAIDASVSVILNIFPSFLLLPGLFLTACLISLSIGTSVGTVVALVPIALGFAEQLDLPTSYMAALVVGGAFFGDNLSFISDTTIAATRTQGVGMRDKFRVNLLIVLPAALVCFTIYAVYGMGLSHHEIGDCASLWLLLPYAVVIATALVGLNVLLVLLLGIVSCGVVGMLTEALPFWDWIKSLGTGISGMGELIIVTLLAGGLLALIRYNGGVAYILKHLTQRISGRRGGELSIALLVMIANICTANNTIAILTTGEVARDISERYGIDRRRTASILDTYACVAQGLIPYGAQLMLAAGFAAISPLQIVGYLYYPMLLALCATLAILFRFPRKFA